MLTFTTDQWVILGLVFVLGLLVGMWMTSGGRRKWKNRYNEELERRRTLERELKEREDHWAGREKEWRERETLMNASARDRDRDAYPDRGPEPYRDRDPDDRPAIGRHPADDRRY